MPDRQSEKKQVRDRVRAKRDKLAPEEIAAKSRAICRSVESTINGHKTVMLYVSKGQEVNTRPLMESLLSQGVGVVVPIIEKETRTLRLSFIDDLSVLVTSTFSVPEPIGNEIPVYEENIGVVIVPLIAFDRKGHRLGYGAGYYDRFLSGNPGLMKIGVAFSCQEVPETPADENDIAMDVIVTEHEIIRCPGNPSGPDTSGNPGRK
ncbi:MAG TPA: 5-formyltetrahydrofolate cyclo-ligase [Methanoregulaceae archaeon]|nr:5-formyltetrahydrofolate cyclo-ligase [Methanoregulaceae archaeon]